MDDLKLDISGFLERSCYLPVFDVRSPAEFLKGHIPGALNLPLFTNEERSLIGTLYVKNGTPDAVMKGLELVGPKMKQFALDAFRFAPEGEVLVHCWRGGMRSNSMAWLLNTVGIKTSILDGGYKSYRGFVHGFFERPFNLIVLGGMTGSGKTEVLEALEKFGKQVIHLERLASHMGSVFGGIGMGMQPTTEQFENELFRQLFSLKPGLPVFVEDESLAIGRIFIPRPFYEQISTARMIHLRVPAEQRIRRLTSLYTGGDPAILIACMRKLERRLGKENAMRAIRCVESGNMDSGVELVLSYYDKLYLRSMEKHQRERVTELYPRDDEAELIAQEVLSLI